MRVPTNALVGTSIGAGIIACLIAVAAVPNDPLPPAVASRWSAIAALSASGRHAVGSTFTVDTVTSGGQQFHYTGSPARLVRAASLSIRGWAFDPRMHRTAERLVFRLDGAGWRDAAYHQDRPDVAAALGLPDIADSGFTVVVPPSTLTPGAHTLELATVVGTAYDELPIRIALVVTAR